MLFSVMMATCYAMKDDKTWCSVRTRYTLPTELSLEKCSNLADAMANESLLETGKEGWAKGFCFEQERYSEVVTGAVSYLEGKGYKVDFTAYKGKSK